jgi:hypothetical protein
VRRGYCLSATYCIWFGYGTLVVICVTYWIINRCMKPIPVAVILSLMDAVSRVEFKTQQECCSISIIYRTCTGQLHNKGIMVLLNNSEAETTTMFNS